MNADPRIAALAAALYRVTLDEEDEGFDGDAGWQFHGSRDDLAAAILAALPEGWCGHEPDIYNGRYTETIMVTARDVANNREIARLRAIEEAARAYRKAAASLIGYVDFARLRKGGDEAQGVWLNADRALRAALREARDE